MKKIVVLLSAVVLLSTVFIPVTQQKTLLIKSSFFDVYKQLANPGNWKKWRPELRKAMKTDSDKIIIHQDSAQFTIQYAGLELDVKLKGNSFDINEDMDGKSTNYSFVMVPVPDKFLNKTLVSIEQKSTAINYLIGKIAQSSFLDEHLNELKSYLETDSLHYGFYIFKTGVPESNLIVIRKKVLNSDRFAEAAKMLTTLQVCVKSNNLKQMQPLIAQFIPVAKDSTQVKIGFFINKEVKSGNGIEFDRMPKGGLLYAARFRGKFYKRGEIYSAMRQYFSDHAFQTVLLPIETYLNNKLPVNDSDSIYMQLNFPALPRGQAH